MSKVFFYYPELVCSVLNYGFVDNLILRQSIKNETPQEEPESVPGLVVTSITYIIHFMRTDTG